MNKKYTEPEFELTKFSFKSIMSDPGEEGRGQHLIDHSYGEIGTEGGNEGFD